MAEASEVISDRNAQALSSDDAVRPHNTAHATRSVLWKLYLSHTLSTWNARTFEFGAVIFLATIFPSTLFYASCYALFRSLAAFLLSSSIGRQVDSKERLHVVRQSIIWQRISVAASCCILLILLRSTANRWTTIAWFSVCVVLACVEKLAFVGNTVAVERDWAVVAAKDLGVPREDLNSAMRRIDLEYFAIAQVYAAVPSLASKKGERISIQNDIEGHHTPPTQHQSTIRSNLQSWKSYALNPAFLASFSLALLYFTVLGFGSQLTTYLLTLGFTSLHISGMRLVSVILELSATCAAPVLMRRIGAVRAGLWFINSQLICTALAIGMFTLSNSQTQTAGLALVAGVALSRLGLWGFDLCVQYLVQEDAPEATRGSFSAVEASLQNLFELCSFAATMIWSRPEQFRYPVWVSGGVVAVLGKEERGKILRPMWPFKKFSLRETPSLIKRDLKRMFSKTARAEKRAEEQRERERLQTPPTAVTVQYRETKTDSQVEATQLEVHQQVPQTPVCTPASSISSSMRTESQSSSSTTVQSDFSVLSPPSTAVTEHSSVDSCDLSPATYDSVMACFEKWYKAHPAASIPEHERWVHRGLITITRIALQSCFTEKYWSLLGYSHDGYRLPSAPIALKQILAALTDNTEDALRITEHLLSLIDPEWVGSMYPRAYLNRIGFPSTLITDLEREILSNEFGRLLRFADLSQL
ncbi:hypothetical protein N0V90_009385 [Kalmusia sp. IMI 367209]|nr:hypothetical protein N0V90_009385 [Kalmusia sp. IMI 367209]